MHKSIFTLVKSLAVAACLHSIPSFAALGSQSTIVEAIALNDYAFDIPAASAVANGSIVASEMDGLPMPVRDKGPLWIVYPYDANPEYRTEAIHSKPNWQLSWIEIK